MTNSLKTATKLQIKKWQSVQWP